MAKKNSINNETQELTLDPGASGDSFVQFDINSTGEFRIGIDDDASDAFKISQGSALGTNDTFIMTSAGERTMPLQSAFLAKLDSTLSNATGDGTTVSPIIIGNEIFDQNSDYNNSTGVFTAPITGRYTFYYGITLNDLTSSHTRGITFFPTSNAQFRGFDISGAAARDSANDLSLSHSYFADMDAADTAEVAVVIQNGTKVVDIFGDGTTTRFTYFGGSLIC